jgi:osmotically-inducible protein OsmY
MKFTSNAMLFGSALMALSAYSAAAPVNQTEEAVAGQGDPIVVTGARSRAEDARISAEVRMRINERPSLRLFNIVVYASEQAVYLEGIVDTALDRDLGEVVAASVPGVRKIYNGLVFNGS